MQTQLADIECAIRSDANVLISGGDSAARSELARFIHQRSTQRQRPMVVLGSRWPPQPKGCTVFIEELAALDGPAQAELRRLLDSPAVRVADDVGGTRIISGTAYDLHGWGTWPFDSDLFYRLNIIHIALGDARRRAPRSPTIH